MEDLVMHLVEYVKDKTANDKIDVLSDGIWLGQEDVNAMVNTVLVLFVEVYIPKLELVVWVF